METKDEASPVEGVVRPQISDEYRNKKTGRSAFVCSTATMRGAYIGLRYPREEGKRGKRIWVRLDELKLKFEKA